MRHFVYLDTDTLNSYLSQINGGLLKSAVNEVKDEVATTQNENTIPGKTNFTTEIGLKPILGFKFSEDKEIVNTTNTLSQIETGRELIEKILHDNAYDQFVAYLKDNTLIGELENSAIGNYVKIEDNFIIRDLNYILNIFSQDLAEFIAEETVKPFRNELNNNKEKLNANGIKAAGKNIESIKSNVLKEYADYSKMFNIIKTILPYSEFVICNNCLIPITKKYLRESLNQIRFNYSEKIKIVGRYTSTLKDSLDREKQVNNSFDDMFSVLDKSFQELYVNTLGFNEDMKIVIPIALYFE
ncbi:MULTISPECIES: hypothetical protein [unclassified Clostridium]|uniref:DUF6414 family protein n=1 Tax=unclassified Clostridium TaxID=2614128 RepID=UPI000297D489|nr:MULTISPECIES: hypothetical protein [unclassified Clostridium]EKQ56413.1 MAG: hypothetical protein A370_02005 [Clostridium sp. Maddingley MBC34-26]